MNAAFKEGAFIPTIGRVVILDTGIPSPAIVAGKDNKRIVVELRVFQLLQHVANPPVKLTHHCAIDALGMVLNLRQRVIVGF